MSNITLFTLQNNTSSTVGPYGLNQVTVPANSQLAINPPLNGMLCDNAFIADLLAQNVSVFIAGQQVQGGILFEFFALLSQAPLSNNYTNVTGNSTVTAKTGSGLLHAIIIGNNTTAGTVTIYDNTAGSGTEIISLTLGSPTGGLLSSSGQPGPMYLDTLNVKFLTGLTIVTTGSTSNNVTVIYQ
jgi:hypothetical protein